MEFTARTVSGLGRGSSEMVPTINLELADIPAELEEGIHACYAVMQGVKLPSVMHFGPRPAIGEGPSCEIHVLDKQIGSAPPELTVAVVAKLRDVEDFDDITALRAQIMADIAVARGILAVHARQA